MHPREQGARVGEYWKGQGIDTHSKGAAHNVPWYEQNKGEPALSITSRGVRRFEFKHLLECVLTPGRIQTTPPVHLGLVLPPFQIFMCSTAIVFYAMGEVRPRVNGRQ
ncbi:hypothetical protein M405DRAFT_383023 [Rhizopogon salebrosus TDB-379]|nr:hypothetical protein M405DRAFT_383023 [Rhizopogon salebrosus TDB-379]